MRLKAVTKDLNEIKGQYSELDIQKFVEESGKQNRERRKS
jgi:hypothetical protein